MSRNKLISDEAVLAVVLKLLLLTGQKSVTFSAVAQRSKLAAPTLVQRYGSCADMVHQALAMAWDQLDAQTSAVIADTSAKGKAVQGMLKALSSPLDAPALMMASLQYPTLAARAKVWREQVEAALATRLGSGEKAKEAAAVAFAAWQGRLLWDAAGGKGFRLGEALKRLT